MGSLNEGIKTFNSTVRTLIAAVVVGGAGLVGYQAYDVYNEPNKRLQEQEAKLQQALGDLQATQSRVEEQQQELAEKTLKIDQLETARYLLKVDQRIAELRVLSQTPGPEEGDPVVTTVEFVETDPEGKQIGEPQRFDVPGEQVYLEYLVVKFDDEYVEQAHLEKGTAICLFRRLFGSAQKPEEGFPLDAPNTRPTAYARGERMSEFEEQLWADFWDLAHDPDRLAELGIRNAQSNSPAIVARPGARYLLELRSTGDLTLKYVAE